MVFLFGSQLTKLLFPSEYDYIITPTDSYWFFPGLVLGFGLIRIPMEFTYKLILKDEYYLYTQYTNSRHGYDGNKIWRPVEWVLTIAGIIIFTAGLNWFVRIDQNNNIEFNELLEIKTHSYKLEEIVEISHIDNYYMQKEIRKKNNYYLIQMNDDFSWNSKTYSFFSIQNDLELINENIKALSEKTGLTIK